MKYYEFNQLDYYALVCAKNQKEAAQIYIDEVAYQQENYEEVLESVEQISEAIALEKIKEALEQEAKGKGVQELELYSLIELDFKAQTLMKEDLQVLLIDRYLC